MAATWDVAERGGALREVFVCANTSAKKQAAASSSASATAPVTSVLGAPGCPMTCGPNESGFDLQFVGCLASALCGGLLHSHHLRHIGGDKSVRLMVWSPETTMQSPRLCFYVSLRFCGIAEHMPPLHSLRVALLTNAMSQPEDMKKILFCVKYVEKRPAPQLQVLCKTDQYGWFDILQLTCFNGVVVNVPVFRKKLPYLKVLYAVPGVHGLYDSCDAVTDWRSRLEAAVPAVGPTASTLLASVFDPVKSALMDSMKGHSSQDQALKLARLTLCSQLNRVEKDIQAGAVGKVPVHVLAHAMRKGNTSLLHGSRFLTVVQTPRHVCLMSVVPDADSVGDRLTGPQVYNAMLEEVSPHSVSILASANPRWANVSADAPFEDLFLLHGMNRSGSMLTTYSSAEEDGGRTDGAELPPSKMAATATPPLSLPALQREVPAIIASAVNPFENVETVPKWGPIIQASDN